MFNSLIYSYAITSLEKSITLECKYEKNARTIKENDSIMLRKILKKNFSGEKVGKKFSNYV